MLLSSWTTIRRVRKLPDILTDDVLRVWCYMPADRLPFARRLGHKWDSPDTDRRAVIVQCVPMGPKATLVLDCYWHGQYESFPAAIGADRPDTVVIPADHHDRTIRNAHLDVIHPDPPPPPAKAGGPPPAVATLKEHPRFQEAAHMADGIIAKQPAPAGGVDWITFA